MKNQDIVYLCAVVPKHRNFFHRLFGIFPEEVKKSEITREKADLFMNNIAMGGGGYINYYIEEI